MKLYSKLASLVIARLNCLQNKETHSEWANKHEENILKLCENNLPSGSGFNWGTEIVFDKCNRERLLFKSKYQCMDENGYHDGVIDFYIFVYPSLAFGFELSIRCSDKDSLRLINKYSLREYLQNVFSTAFDIELEDV